MTKVSEPMFYGYVKRCKGKFIEEDMRTAYFTGRKIMAEEIVHFLEKEFAEHCFTPYTDQLVTDLRKKYCE